MRKLFAVFKRELFQVIRKKSFLIMTILTPFLLLALVLVPSLLMVRGQGGKRVAVLDATGELREAFEGPRNLSPTPSVRGRMRGSFEIRFEYVAIKEGLERERQANLARLTGKDVPEERRLDGVLAIPSDALTNPETKIAYYSRAAADFIVAERLARIVNQAISRERLVARGIALAETENLLARVPIDGVQISKSGKERKGGEFNFLAAFLFAALLLIPMLAYGQEIMRGIVQEKTDRVVEILVSSMSPLELLSGKILGLAAAGLAQVGIWLAMAGVVAAYLGGTAAAAGINPLQFVDLRVIPFFLVFYLLGYLTFSSVYAIGGAVANSDKEAQQFVMPIMFLILVPWFLASSILQNPESRLAVVLSLFPIFSPITMFLRIVVSEPAPWQIALSIFLSAATIVGLFWVTAKIFRVGILSYGKRPTVPELWRWLKVA